MMQQEQQLTRQFASPLVTMAIYCDIASSLDMPFTLFHASHLARASICTAHGCDPSTSPTVACDIVRYVHAHAAVEHTDTLSPA